MSKNWHDVPSAEDWGRRPLSQRERRVVRTALSAFLAGGSSAHPRPADESWCDRVADCYELSIGHASVQVRLAMHVLLFAFEWLAPIVQPGWAPMSARNLHARITYLDDLEHHRIALFTMLLVAIKVPMLLSAFEEGEPLEMTGFDRPTTFARRKLPLTTGGEP